MRAKNSKDSIRHFHRDGVLVGLIVVLFASPAAALWGNTKDWTKNKNVLKTRNPMIIGVVIPGFGDPIEERAGRHGYVIGVDKANGKVCAITAQHCMIRQDKAYGDHFPAVPEARYFALR
jgi:hypothetical protein